MIHISRKLCYYERITLKPSPALKLIVTAFVSLIAGGAGVHFGIDPGGTNAAEPVVYQATLHEHGRRLGVVETQLQQLKDDRAEDQEHLARQLGQLTATVAGMQETLSRIDNALASGAR